MKNFSSQMFVALNNVEQQKIEYLDPKDFNQSDDQVFNDALRAAEAHKRIRSNLQTILKPGVGLFEIIDMVETSTRILLKGEKNNGIGFPCGVNINDCAAHFSLNPGDNNIFLKESDCLKIDYGVHSNGRIMDSAFTVCFDPAYEQLLRASQEATKKGLQVIGIDSLVCEIGREIKEVFDSFEITLNNTTKQIKPIFNLNGHSIEQYKIHGKISIPPYNNKDKSRVQTGFCAIETFATTGDGMITDRGESSHFMFKPEIQAPKIYNAKNKQVFEMIKKEFGTLPFSPRHADYYIKDSYSSIKLLSARSCIDPYPPLYEIPNSHVAQFEHTIYITENGKTIMTKGNDY